MGGLGKACGLNSISCPARAAGFLYNALIKGVAENPGHYLLVGDNNGAIPIAAVNVVNAAAVAGQPATATIELEFDNPLPDDRYTLTIADALVDPAGNNLDGENDGLEPGVPSFPTGDGVPGGTFAARFTVDSRPEIGVWADGSVWVDTNGNFVFDPENPDNSNEDIVYVMGSAATKTFAGNFATGGGNVADGFDKLGYYARVNGQYTWFLDTNNDGVIDLTRAEPQNLNAYPVAGNFDRNPSNGDEVGLFTGSEWWLYRGPGFTVETRISSAIIGYPIVGDFDGDGHDDLATWTDDQFQFDFFDNGFGTFDAVLNFGFSGVRERPVAADMDGDGIDDIGLWVPDRTSATPGDVGEWYFLISDDFAGTARTTGQLTTLSHDFSPIPFGKDIYAQYGDSDALPIVGNFDPPPETVEHPVEVVEVGSGMVGQGNAVRLPVRLAEGAAGLHSARLVIHYDTAALDVANGDIALGGLVSGLQGAQAWTLTTEVDDAAGTITALLDSALPLAGGTGNLLEIVCHAAADAPLGATPLDLDEGASYLNDGQLGVTAADGILTVSAPGPAWQNPNHQLDVNPDCCITTQDALLLANFLYHYGQQPVPEGPGTPPFPASPSPYYDVSGDGYVTTGDVLMVANFLYHNGQQPVGQGQGASPSPVQASASLDTGSDGLLTTQDTSTNAAAPMSQPAASAPARALVAQTESVALLGKDKATQRIGLAAFLVDEALRATMRPGDPRSAEGQVAAGLPIATSTITDDLRKEQTTSSAEGVAWNAAAVDQTVADMFKDDGLDFIDQGVVDDAARATLPPSDGETLDDFFAQFHASEELATGCSMPAWL